MAVNIAGLRSRDRERQVVKVDEVFAELEPPSGDSPEFPAGHKGLKKGTSRVHQGIIVG